MASASAAVISSSAFFPLSSPKFSPHFHPRAALPRGEFLGCGARLRPPGPHFRRRRVIQSRFPRFLVRALYDGRSVLLALAAAAANFALLRLLYQNYTALRKKSNQLSGYTESGVQESVTSPKQASDITQKGETENEIEELRYSHTLAPEFDTNTDIRKNETVTLIDLTNGVATTTDAMTASSACVMLEESIVRTQTPERDMHECILGRKSEAVSVAVEVTRRTAEPSPMSTHVENRDTERVQDEGFYHDVADNQQSSYGTEDNAQRENLLTFDTITPSALVFSAALEGTRPESIREDSSLASAFNKVGVSSRIKRPVNGRSFIKEKTFNRNIDNKVTPLPNGTHVRRKSDPSEYLKTYNRFLRDGRLTDCVELLENAEKNGFLDMDKVYHVRFLNSCKSQKAVKEAFRFVKLIRNPTMSTFNMLLSVCANSQDFEGAFQVLLLVKEADLKADCKLYTTLISTCAKSGKVDAMFEIFHEMVNAGVEPNVHTYGALIDGCARAGQVAKAFGAYGIMSSKKVKPDRVIFNALITACGQSGAVDRAFDVLAEMGAEPTPIEPDHVTVGALIKTCVQAGQVDRAREVYKLMHQYNIRGTPEVYTIAVNSCSETGDLEFALSVYNDMKRNGVIPDEMFLSALIDAAGHAGKVNVAFEILQKARNQGVKLGNISYSSLMGACCNSKNWQKALELYEDIKAIKLLPTVSTVNALITSLCEADQLQKSVEVLAEVKEAGVVLNAITYSVLLVACERNDDVELGFKLFSEAKMDGFIPNVIMCRCLTGRINCVVQGLCLRRFEKAYSCGEPIFSFSSGKFELDNKWTSLALLIYRETIGAGDVPSMEIFSQVLGCLKLPHDASLRNTLVENLGVSSEASKRFNTYSLLDGFGEYDPRSFSLFEEAASLGVVPCATFKESPIVVDTRKLEVRISEVYLITVLKGLKHRLAAGARLPNIIILLYTEKTQLTSPRGDRTVALAGRVGQAICAMLRRMGLPYQGKESYGKIRINGLSLRRWFQPKLTSSESKPAEPSLLRTSLARGIIDQQRDIRTSNLSID